MKTHSLGRVPNSARSLLSRHASAYSLLPFQQLGRKRPLTQRSITTLARKALKRLLLEEYQRHEPAADNSLADGEFLDVEYPRNHKEKVSTTIIPCDVHTALPETFGPHCDTKAIKEEEGRYVTVMRGREDVAAILAEALHLQFAFGFQQKPRILSSSTSGFYNYVATFQPATIRYLLSFPSLLPGNSIYDPFVGSGTVLIESLNQKFRIKRRTGVDLSPFACFITRNQLWRPTLGDRIKVMRKFAHINESLGEMLNSKENMIKCEAKSLISPRGCREEVEGSSNHNDGDNEEIKSRAPSFEQSKSSVQMTERNPVNANKTRQRKKSIFQKLTADSTKKMISRAFSPILSAVKAVEGDFCVQNTSEFVHSCRPLWFVYAVALQRALQTANWWRKDMHIKAYDGQLNNVADLQIKAWKLFRECFIEYIELVEQSLDHDDISSEDPRVLISNSLGLLLPEPVDIILTSPPYPGVYDYQSIARKSRFILDGLTQPSTPCRGLDKRLWPAQWLSKEEMGARKAYRKLRNEVKYSKLRGDSQNPKGIRDKRKVRWEADQKVLLTSMFRNLKEGGRALLILGNGILYDNILTQLYSAALSMGFEVLASATVIQKGRKGKRQAKIEHAIILQKPVTNDSTPYNPK